MSRRAQVPVMVTVVVDDERPIPDSAEVAVNLHELVQDGHVVLDGTYVITSIDAIPADEDDPNSPPVPGERLMSLEGQEHLPGMTE